MAPDKSTITNATKIADPKMMSSKLSSPLLPSQKAQQELWLEEAKAVLPHNANQHLITQIAAIIYAAPHLHLIAKRLANTHPQDAEGAANAHYEGILSDAESALSEAIDNAYDEATLMSALRHYRYRCFFALALSELTGHITSARQSYHLSQCAEIALRLILTRLCDMMRFDKARIVILAMGKLGAEELNYSSDIDLIILYKTSQLDNEADKAVKITKQLVQIFQTQTADGFAWRVDLRLRPDPGATEIALSYEAAISYYESVARSWERAVFVRARPVAGNCDLGHAFLQAISPFIWRRQLDYSLLGDMTNWITHYPMSKDGTAFDVKKGAFAIRHIEMMTSLLQLLHGGRDKALRTHRTDIALQSLGHSGHISDHDSQQAIFLYWQWRAIEHRLQYCRDTHIYQLPKSPQEFQQFARFAGFETSKDLYDYLISMQELTKKHANHRVIKDLIAAHIGARQKGVWPADEDSQKSYLQQMGFTRPEQAMQMIESWLSGRYNATRSERARTTLTNLLPVVIEQLAKGDDIDSHFIGFAQFLESLPAGVQVFSLLHQHPQLIKLISNFTLGAPALMHDLTQHPHIFEQMLGDAFFAPLSSHQDFTTTLATLTADKPPEMQLDAIRLFAKEAKFRAEAHILTYPENAEEAHGYLSELADACLLASFQVTMSAFEADYGKVPESELAILLLGRAGEKRLTPQSDIDLIFIYDGHSETMSDGEKQLSCGHYYQRLAQRLVSWMSTKTASGALYELDTRLRPNGNAGPLATHFESWHSYLIDNAWPFEKLALRKARLLPHQQQKTTKLHHKIHENLQEIQSASLPQEQVISEISLLRDKLAHQSTETWDFKKQRGGLLDCEFFTHITAHRPDLADILNHLSLIKAVMMPKSSTKAPPLSFQKELCRVMQQSSFDEASKSLASQMAALATALDKKLGL